MADGDREGGESFRGAIWCLSLKKPMKRNVWGAVETVMHSDSRTKREAEHMNMSYVVTRWEQKR